MADFLLWLWETMPLYLSSIKAHCSILSTVFIMFKLHEFGDHHVVRDLIRPFAIECPHPPMPLSWEFDIVLKHLMSSTYESLESIDFRTLYKKTFLLALATAKRVGELQAPSKRVTCVADDMVVSYLPLFCCDD